MIKKLIYVICLACLGMSCADDILEQTSVSHPVPEMVSVQLLVGVQQYDTPFSLRTRASGKAATLSASYSDMDIELVDMPEPVTRAGTVNEDDAIYTYTILQFNGTGNGATLLAKKTYSNTTGIVTPENVNLTKGIEKNRIVVIANVPGADFNHLEMNVYTYSSLQQENFIRDEGTNPSYPRREMLVSGVNKKVIVMCGVTDAIITEGKHVSVSLLRTVAKVNFNITVASGGGIDTYNAWVASLHNLPSKSYINTLGRTPVFPAPGTDFYLKPLGVVQGQSPVITINDVYIPVNLQLPIPGSDKDSRRNNGPVGGTYLQIVGQIVTPLLSHQSPPQGRGTFVADYVIYQIFLGENFSDDFSISPNYNLKYNITLKGKSEKDSNVVQFIPGYFGGELGMFDANNNLTDLPEQVVKWRYKNKVEVYFEDARYNSAASLQASEMVGGIGRTDMKWSRILFNALGTRVSIINGYTNTKDIQGSNTTYTIPFAAHACFFGLNGGKLTTQTIGQYSKFDWYLPAIGQLIGIWTAAASVHNTLSNAYWSSTVDVNGENVYIITNKGAVRKELTYNDKKRYYVRGIRELPEPGLDDKP